jgi:hypothetical protein
MSAEECYQCGGWTEPPFTRIGWNSPATVDDVFAFVNGGECNVVRIERALCRYCAHAISQGADLLTEEGKDELDLSDESNG